MTNIALGYEPGWLLPPNVNAFVTFRHPGASRDPYDSFNLGDHVGDDPKRVEKNRQTLVEQLNLPQPPNWLQQVHGRNVVDGNIRTTTPVADGIYTDSPNIVCAVLTADCLPILLCSKDGTEISAVHAGWKGLLNGVISAALEKFYTPREDILAYIGPGISMRNYQVGVELRDKFITADTRYGAAFRQCENLPVGKLYLGLAQIAKMQLAHIGLNNIVDSDICTFDQASDFYSYRRDDICGRFASLIWRSS